MLKILDLAVDVSVAEDVARSEGGGLEDGFAVDFLMVPF